MNTDYEELARPFKKMMFCKIFNEFFLSRRETAIVIELGIGLFSNAAYYPEEIKEHIHIIGVEPDTSRHEEAMKVAKLHGVNLRMITCWAEALPFADCSVDVILSTCTLCTVRDPATCLQEAKRVLKYDGILGFWEHVLCKTDHALAFRQIHASDDEFETWGCRFDRHTLERIQEAGFARVFGIVDEECYLELTNAGLMSSTAAGVAYK